MAMHNENAGMFLQKVYNNMARNFELQTMDAYQHLSHCNIDKLVDMEMKRLRNTYQLEEETFVEQMLQENPIIVERRCVPKRNELHATPCTPTASTHASSANERNSLLQQQRAESCRKSRINNKIKKAKTKYRHKYITNKLTQSANMLDCIKDVIAQAEAQLLCQGYTETTLQNLRSTFGIDRSVQHEDDNMLRQME